MKVFLKKLLGMNGAALVHLLRFNPHAFGRACEQAFFVSRGALSIPDISLGEIVLGRKCDIHLAPSLKAEDGALPIDQLIVLLAVAAAESPDIVLEIGTFMGQTTKQLAENLPAATIHTIDLPEAFALEADISSVLPKDDFHLISRRVVGREFKGSSCQSRIVQHYGDTATWNFHNAGNPTLFFIDGSHTYEYCKNDSEKCFELCDGRGVFIWHDCDNAHPGVVKFLSEWRGLGRDVRLIRGTPLAYWKSF